MHIVTKATSLANQTLISAQGLIVCNISAPRKATAIEFIDGKCHIKKQKNHKTALSGYYACFM